MKTKTASALAIPQPAVVDVTIPLGGFVDIIDTIALPGFDRLCTASVRLRTPAPDGISQAAPTPLVPFPPLIVTRDMKIDFYMPFSLSHQFRLSGISFRRTVGTGAGDGADNLPKEHIKVSQDTNGSTISIRDVWQKHGKPGTQNWIGWEMFFLVQNSGGDVGLIDPDILNEE